MPAHEDYQVQSTAELSITLPDSISLVDESGMIDVSQTPAYALEDPCQLFCQNDFVDIEAYAQQCIELYVQYEAPRLPCVHKSQMKGSSALRYGMAALGALHSSDFKNIALNFHEASTSFLADNFTPLPENERLQSCILGIEFGLWSRRRKPQQWAIQEAVALANRLRPYSSSLNLCSSPMTWEKWLQVETTKRATCCFFITAVLARAFLGHPICVDAKNISAQLPCSDVLWQAETREEWELASIMTFQKEPMEDSLSEALHGLLSRDTTRDCGLEGCTLFDQYMLLAAVLDTIVASKSLLGNYTTTKGWQQEDMATFIPKQALNETLRLCKISWSGNAESSWHNDGEGIAHMDSENAMLLQYMHITLNGPPGSICTKENGNAIDASIELFVSCSRIGFARVAESCRTSISRPGRHCAVAAAGVLRSWVQHTPIETEHDTNENERARLWQVRQACRRGVREGMIHDMDDLAAAVAQLWSSMLGLEWLTTNENF